MFDAVTARYTEALFGLAKSRGVLDQVAGDVNRIGAEFANPDVASFFFDARVSTEARRQKLGPLLSGMHELTRNFVNLLFDKRRENVLGGLGPSFHKRMLTERGATDGVVESARPLGSAELGRLASALGARVGKSVSLQNRIVPELVGGVRVIVENRMIDVSLRGRLEGLRKSMLDAPLPSLQ